MRAGGSLLTTNCAADDPDTFNTRDRSFLKTILTFDYLRNKHSIFLYQLAFMSANPGVQFYTLFDYRGGDPAISCHAAEGEIPLDDFRPQWFDCLGRATASAGKMAVHVMAVGEGAVTRWRIFPLRSGTSRIHDRLVEMANEIPLGTTESEIMGNFPEILSEVIALFEADDGLYTR